MNSLPLTEEKEHFQLPHYAHCVFTQPRLLLAHLMLLTLSSLRFSQHLHFLSACQHEKLFCSYALKVSTVPSQRPLRLLPVGLHLIASLILRLHSPGLASILAHSQHPTPQLVPPEPQVLLPSCYHLGFPFYRSLTHPALERWQDSFELPHMFLGKECLSNRGDSRNLSSIPGSGRSSAGGNCSPLQYSCLENPMDRGAWWATVLGVAKSQTRLSRHRAGHMFLKDPLTQGIN